MKKIAKLAASTNNKAKNVDSVATLIITFILQ